MINMTSMCINFNKKYTILSALIHTCIEKRDSVHLSRVDKRAIFRIGGEKEPRLCVQRSL